MAEPSGRQCQQFDSENHFSQMIFRFLNLTEIYKIVRKIKTFLDSYLLKIIGVPSVDSTSYGPTGVDGFLFIKTAFVRVRNRQQLTIMRPRQFSRHCLEFLMVHLITIL